MASLCFRSLAGIGAMLVLVAAGPVLARPPEVIIVPQPPPPVVIETRPYPPAPHAVWIDGHWEWTGRRYVWVAGFWEMRPRGHWAPGHWRTVPGGWAWAPGGWR